MNIRRTGEIWIVAYKKYEKKTVLELESVEM